MKLLILLSLFLPLHVYGGSFTVLDWRYNDERQAARGDCESHNKNMTVATEADLYRLGDSLNQSDGNTVFWAAKGGPGGTLLRFRRTGDAWIELFEIATPDGAKVLCVDKPDRVPVVWEHSGSGGGVKSDVLVVPGDTNWGDPIVAKDAI